MVLLESLRASGPKTEGEEGEGIIAALQQHFRPRNNPAKEEGNVLVHVALSNRCKEAAGCVAKCCTRAAQSSLRVQLGLLCVRARHMASEPYGVVLLCFYVGAYLTLNVGLNYFNAFILGSHEGQLHLGVPIFYTLCHQVTGLVITSLTLFRDSSDQPKPTMALANTHGAWLLLMSFVFSTSIASQNMSLTSIDLTMNSVIKGMLPIPTMIFSYCLEGKTYSLRLIGCVLLMLVSVVLTTMTGRPSTSSEIIGYVLVFYSLISTAVRPVVAARLMATGELSPLTMAWFDSAGSLAILAPLVLILERQALAERMSDASVTLAGAVVIGSAMAAVYNIVVFHVVRATSSVTYIVIGNFKQVVLIGGAALIIDHLAAPVAWAGVLLFLVSSGLYTWVKYTEGEAAKQAAAAAKQGPHEATPLNKA